MKHNNFVITALIVGTLLTAANRQPQETEPSQATLQPAVSLHKLRTFDLSKIPFLTDAQKKQHYTLYEGYVKKLNEIRSKLPQTAGEPGITYSTYRALKNAETFALNGVLLHELYFENIIDAADTVPGEKITNLIIASFGSTEAFMQDLRNATLCARGWVITGYTTSDNRIHNYVLDAHNETVPVCTIPLIVIDVYEHAYMIDFGIKRADYVDQLLNNLNWNVIESRAKNIQ